MSGTVLLIREPGKGPRRVWLEEGKRLVVGRGTGAELLLEDSTVSRRHAEIRFAGGRLVVTDLESRHGSRAIGPGGERLLPPGREVGLEPGETLHLGGTEIVPCEPLGEEVFVSDASVPPGLEATREESRGPGPPTPEEAFTPGRLLAELEGIVRGDDPWARVLAALTKVPRAERGFLLGVADGRFVLRAARGVDGPVVLSRSFLEETARRPSAWAFRTGEDGGGHGAGDSLLRYRPGLLLIGVRFPGRDHEPTAVACLEADPPLRAGVLPALDLVARATAPLLHLSRELDLATRRETAALAALGEHRAERSVGAGDEMEEPVLVGESPVFRRAVEEARRAAGAEATVLLMGPSGSGKGQLARLIHAASRRRRQPFVPVNCAAIPEGLMESELFGHERGAFTGAHRDRAGVFERADGGTIFLDEIGDLSLAAQAKLLRVLETGEVRRLGGATRRVDVRVVAATHRDLAARVREGTFREDLWYRLRVIEIVLPPLRERPEDVLSLARHFLAGLRRPDGGIVEGLSARAARALAAYGWPGNVRELRNVLERAVVLDRDGIVDVDDLPPELGAGDAALFPGGPERSLSLPWSEARRAWERAYFEALLLAVGGNVKEAARRAGVDRRTVTNKIRRLRLQGVLARARGGRKPGPADAPPLP